MRRGTGKFIIGAGLGAAVALLFTTEKGAEIRESISKKAKELIDLLGVEKFFFGTDFPMWDAKAEIERFNKLPLTEKEREMIFSKNIKRLLNLD